MTNNMKAFLYTVLLCFLVGVVTGIIGTVLQLSELAIGMTGGLSGLTLWLLVCRHWFDSGS